MDRSFLSDARVIAAARDFVCVRLSTYESAEEAVILESIFVGRSGDLENTTFVLLASDGKTRLSRSGRSPHFVYDGPADMAEDMRRITSKTAAQAKAVKDLPVEVDLRLAMNVASCEGLPLACVVAEKPDAKADEAVAAAAWSDAWRGRFVWVRATPAEVEKTLGKDAASARLVIAAPDEFGRSGRVSSSAKTLDRKAVDAALKKGLASHRPEARDDIHGHVERGRHEGVNWKTKIPVTDPGPGGRREPPPPGPRGRSPRGRRL